ncbi:MAG: PD-(D/E)XK motif protein [Rhodocyclaceae bacterium]|nr:PD-(D/E)XK motif protein [Rhodocyclaceae bacterium]
MAEISRSRCRWSHTGATKRVVWRTPYASQLSSSDIRSDHSVKSWRAPKASHQDFQLATGSVEVKTTAAKQPQSVRITSERQLDQTGIPALFLHVVILDERVIEDDKKTTGETLPEMEASLRALLKGDPLVEELFDDKLLDAGYLQADVPRYVSRRYSIRKELTTRVDGDFPRLVEKDLPNGVEASLMR